jgi:hypothetical protein
VNGICANTHICFPGADNGATCVRSDTAQCKSGCCVNGICSDPIVCFPYGNPAGQVQRIGAGPILGNYAPPPPPPAPAPAPAPWTPAPPASAATWFEGQSTWYNACGESCGVIIRSDCILIHFHSYQTRPRTTATYAWARATGTTSTTRCL